MKIGSRGLKLLKEFEGCKLQTYKCSANKLTIGWGHTGPDVKADSVWTQQKADDVLLIDLKRAETAINTSVRFRLNQNQFDALVCFAYNVGIQAFADSTMRRLLNEGSPEKAALQFARWDKVTTNGVTESSAGLARRRRAEQTLFTSEVK